MYFTWIKLLSPIHWAFQSVMVGQWLDYGSINCSENEDTNNQCIYEDGKQILNIYSIDVSPCPSSFPSKFLSKNH